MTVAELIVALQALPDQDGEVWYLTGPGAWEKAEDVYVASGYAHLI